MKVYKSLSSIMLLLVVVLTFNKPNGVNGVTWKH